LKSQTLLTWKETKNTLARSFSPFLVMFWDFCRNPEISLTRQCVPMMTFPSCIPSIPSPAEWSTQFSRHRNRIVPEMYSIYLNQSWWFQEEYITQLRLGDLEPQREEDHIALNISNPEIVDFGKASDKSASTRIIVLFYLLPLVDFRILVRHYGRFRKRVLQRKLIY